MVTGFIYGQVLNNYFLNDDFGRYLNLVGLQNLSLPHALVALFTTEYCPYYRPFTFLSFFLLQKIAGSNTWVYYFSSILLHVFSSIAVYLVAKSLTNEEHPRAIWFALVTALLFAVHPRQVESVSYIHDNENIICGLFFFVGLLCFMRYCRYTNILYLFCSCLCYLFSLFGKEMGVTLPLTCFAYYAIFLPNPIGFRSLYRDPLIKRAVFSFGTTFLLYLVMRYQVLGTIVGGAGETARLSFSLTRMVRTLIQAGIAMVIPNDIPGLQILAEFFRPRVVLFIIISFVVAGVILWHLWHLGSRRFWLGTVWSLISLFPILNNGIAVHELTGGRYLYIPLAGFSLAIADLLIRIKNTSWTVFVAGSILVLLSGFTYRNNMMMSFASHVSERFLKGLGEVIDHTNDKTKVVLVPKMYRGIYMLGAGLGSSVTFLYGDRGRDFLERTSELSLQIESTDGIALDISREDEGSVKIVLTKGAVFLRNMEFYDEKVVKDMRLTFLETRVINTKGDYVASTAQFARPDLIIAPDFRKPNSKGIVMYSTRGDSVMQLDN